MAMTGVVHPLVVLVALMQGAEPRPSGPGDAESLARSLKSLRGTSDPAPKAEALAAAVSVDDARVADAVAPFLRDGDGGVRSAAVRALRYVKNEKALQRLMDVEKDRDVRKDEDLLAEIVYAIGQHGSPKGLPALIDGVWSGTVDKSLLARFLAIAHIRDRASIETLIKLLDQGVAKGGPRNSHAGPVFRALKLLTGRDLGDDVQAWKAWWRAAGNTFEVPAEPVGLDEKEAKAWQRLWAPPSARVAGSPGGAKGKRDPRRGGNP